ncbi:AAA family ATPase [Dyella terrae]|uniref:AAA family ATPase n=1 Tax=Dyella terrae TaxID=522259 RepID=UPI001EFDF54C|nr:fimbrial protein [Dyella terrae]ULU26383.1 fimbrial protein [Dyella terrae]
MQANPTVVTLAKPTLEPTLLLYSPDENNAQRFSARLRNLVTLSWCDSNQFSASRRVLDQHQPRLVLLDFSKGYTDASAEIARQLMALDPGLTLLGIGAAASDRGAGVLGAMRAGLKEFIDIDAGDEEILEQLKTALEQLKTAASGQPARAVKRGQLVLVCGVRPGLGSSTLAAHLGALAASAKPQTDAPDSANNVMLLDLGHSSGDVGLYLGTGGDFHLDDALRNANRVDATLVRTAVPRHASGTAVLGQPRERNISLAGAEVAPLLERLLSMFDLVLCDLDSRALDDVAHSLLKLADEIWLVTDQSIGSMVALDACLRQLERAQARDLRVSLVVNRYDEACGITGARMSERFSLPLLATLPERSRPLRAAANRGSLLHETSPNDAYVRALSPLLSRFRLRVKREADKGSLKALLNRLGGNLWKRR